MSPTPFSVPSTLPYEMPPFAEIRDEHYLPAFEEAVAEQTAEIQAILASGEPSFENTMVALERSGAALGRVLMVFYNKQSADTNPAIDAADEVIAPKFSAHRDSIRLNPELFARIDVLFQKRHGLGLDAESLWLLERYHREFSLAGAGLNQTDRDKLKAINEEISLLSTQFDKQLLADTNDLAVLVSDYSDLEGLSENEIAAASAAAHERGEAGKWLLNMVNYTGHPALTSLKNRELRKKLIENALVKGNRGNENDTKATLLRMVQLRAYRARLLGFKNHAEAVDHPADQGHDPRTLAILDAPADETADEDHPDRHRERERGLDRRELERLGVLQRLGELGKDLVVALAVFRGLARKQVHPESNLLSHLIVPCRRGPQAIRRTSRSKK